MYGIAIIIILLDRVTKMWALHACVQEQPVTSFFSCVLTSNRGIAWSLFHTKDTHGFFAVSLLIALVTVCFGSWTYLRYQRGQQVAGSVAVLAGAVSNLVDRFLYGGVIDFIYLHTASYGFPVFNIADTAICLGVAYMVFYE